MAPRWIVEFRSHAEGPADVHYVSVRADGALHAVRAALVARPPLHDWVLASARPWPRGARGIDAAVDRLAG